MHMYIDYNRICENYIGGIRELMTFFLILVITHIKKKGLIFPFQFLKPNHFCNILMNKLIFPKKNMYLEPPYIYWIKVTRGWQINRQRRFVKYNKMGRALLHNCSLRNFIYCPHFSGYENLTMFCHDLVRSFLNISENREISLLVQTWKKARTRGHCPRKFLRIAKKFYCGRLCTFIFRRKLISCGNVWWNIWYLVYL